MGIYDDVHISKGSKVVGKKRKLLTRDSDNVKKIIIRNFSKKKEKVVINEDQKKKRGWYGVDDVGAGNGELLVKR